HERAAARGRPRRAARLGRPRRPAAGARGGPGRRAAHAARQRSGAARRRGREPQHRPVRAGRAALPAGDRARSLRGRERRGAGRAAPSPPVRAAARAPSRTAARLRARDREGDRSRAAAALSQRAGARARARRAPDRPEPGPRPPAGTAEEPEEHWTYKPAPHTDPTAPVPARATRPAAAHPQSPAVAGATEVLRRLAEGPRMTNDQPATAGPFAYLTISSVPDRAAVTIDGVHQPELTNATYRVTP